MRITLKKLETGETLQKGDYTLNEVYNPNACIENDELEDYFRIVNQIPEGYEICDLKHATKVLIGGTWCDVDFSVGINLKLDGKLLDLRGYFSGLGVLAIRPIPETTSGEDEVETWDGEAILRMPQHLVGKTVKWEEKT